MRGTCQPPDLLARFRIASRQGRGKFQRLSKGIDMSKILAALIAAAFAVGVYAQDKKAAAPAPAASAAKKVEPKKEEKKAEAKKEEKKK